MKRIRIIITASAITLFVVFYEVVKGSISWQELLNGAILGALVSISVSLPFEYLNYSNEQVDKVKSFFWEGVAPYNNLLGEIFAYSRDFSFLENIIFEKTGPSKDTSDWREYESVYLDNQELLEKRIENFSNVIIDVANKNYQSISLLSSLLQNIDKKTVFGRDNKIWHTCYEVYHILENIDWTLQEARDILVTISGESSSERNCQKLIVVRWVSDVLYNNYDRGITDLDPQEVNTTDDAERGKADLDLDKAMQRLAKEL